MIEGFPVVRKSENPNKRKRSKNDQRIQEIIRKEKSKGRDDLDKIEEQILNDDIDDIKFENPLPKL